jgi:hypothetical protein
MSGSQIGIGTAQPILSGRTKDVKFQGVFQSECTAWQIGRNDDHLARTHDYHGLGVGVGADPELQSAAEYVGDLFILMRVTRHFVALGESHLTEHHPLAGHNTTRHCAL